MSESLKKLVVTGVLVLAGIVAARYLLAPRPVDEPAHPPPTADSYGCFPPSHAIFSKLGLDVSVASTKYSSLVLGKVDVKTDPGIVDLVGKASREAEVRDYLRCLAISRDKFSPEQASYTDRFNAFMATNPAPDLFVKWQKDNPFPRKTTLVERTADACGILNVTAEWQGMDAPEQKQVCNYSAPTHCKILSASTEKLSDNNGSNSLSVSPDGRSLTATVTARPHGTALDRKRGWIEIKVTAKLQCEEQTS